MKILFLTRQNSVAGSSYSIYYLAKGLAARGHKVWIGARESAFALKLADQDQSIRTTTFAFRGYSDWRTAKAISAFVKENQINIVNAQSGQDRVMVILAKVLFGLSCTVVFTRRQRPRDEPWLKRALHTWTATRIVVISEGLRKLFLKKGYQEKHLKVIHNGLPGELETRIVPEVVEKLRQEYQLDSDHQVVGCVSRLKEQHQIIAAAAHLPENLTFLFVGIKQAELQEHIDLHQPKQRLLFTSSTDHDLVLHHYKLMDINILSSKMDGFGLTLVEAMALGVPVIGSDFGGIRDVIGDNENGLLFQNGDIGELTHKIKLLLTDQNLRTRLIEKGRKAYQEKFHIDHTVENYEQFFLACI